MDTGKLVEKPSAILTYLKVEKSSFSSGVLLHVLTTLQGGPRDQEWLINTEETQAIFEDVFLSFGFVWVFLGHHLR